MTRTSRWKKFLIGLACLVLAAAGVVLLLRGRADAASDGPIVTVAKGSVAVRVEEVGIIEPMRKVELKSKVAGQVAKVAVDVGDRVRAGDVLVELDPRDTKKNLALAAAQYRVNQASLEQARALLGFKEKAHALGVLSDLELASVRGDVRRLEAQTSVHVAEQSQLSDQLDYTRLRSPIDGVVLARNVEPGELVTPGMAALVDGKPLMVVAQVDRLLARTELNQLDVARLRVGHAVHVQVDAIAGREFKGEVFRIAAMAQKSERRPNSQLQVFPVDVVVEGKQPGADALKPGMVADLRVDIEAHDDVLTIPLEAIVYERNKPHLRKLGADGAESLVPVELGFQNATVAELVSGVSEGDRVRVRPADTEARNKD